MKNPLRISLLVYFLITLSACNLPTNAPTTAPTAIFTTTSTAMSTATSVPVETLPQPSATTPPVTATAVSATVTQVPAIDQDVLRNFTYWLTDFNTSAAFQDGVLDTPGDTPPGGLHLRGRIIDPIATGDLNGDGLPDAAVMLAVNSGGSGTFFDLVTLLNQNGAPVQAASDWIGDRQAVKNLQITDGKIILDFMTQGPNDPLCCPSQHRLRVYRFENGALQIESDTVVN